jgi:two-component system OmpR family sensor kinase
MTLYNKIRIIFLVAILLLTAFFISYFYIQKESYFKENEKRFIQTALFSLQHFSQNLSMGKPLDFNDKDYQFYLNESNFELIKTEEILHIRQNSNLLLNRPLLHTQIRIWKYKYRLYLFIVHPNFKLLLKDKYEVKLSNGILLSYIFSLLFLLGLYFWLIKSLKPLKTLHRKIKTVAKGDLAVSFKSEKHDEIAQVSNAFDDALRKLESLINSRQLFLRTIMHELKTPIGKGRLLNEFLEDKAQKESYDAVFERLELLIEEFSKIEKMLSSSYKLKLASYNVQEMIYQALELMIMDDKEIEKQVTIVEEEAFKLTTDFELFSLALKNLIDNALKYSPNHKVTIKIYKNRIEILNDGVQFTEDLEEYTQPFNPKGKGLGLGLYIIQNIMLLLKLNISYMYNNKENIFTIKELQ